jgi:cytidylate kinase
MSELVVTIDGPAGSGKSTVARRLAERIGAAFLDTGAMYRAVTLAAVRDGVALSDERQLVGVAARHRFDFEAAEGKMLVSIDGQDVTEAIRDSELTAQVRFAASAPLVREKLVQMQRAFAAKHARIVTEGRDQGTVVFPDAHVKFYLTADAAERARRRKAELDARGEPADLEQIRQALEARDRRDESRAVGPLKPAPDAVMVDTTHLAIEEVVERVYRHVEERTGPRNRPPCEASPDSQSGATISQPTVEVGTDKAVAANPHDDQAWHRLKVAWYWVARFGCQVFCATFFRLRIYGRENVPRGGAYILAGNHQSYLDPVFCGVGIRRRLTFVARDTLFRYRLFAWLIHSLNAIPIERGKPDVSAIKAFIARLRKGEAVCLYPEATRTYDGRIIPFKPGFGLLCRRAKASVVPVLVDGAFECWPRQRKFFVPGRVTIWYGKTLDPETLRTMTNEQLADYLTATLRQMQHDCRLKQGKQPYDYST